MRMYLTAIDTEERERLAMLTRVMAVASQGSNQEVKALIRALSGPAG
jgi:hypothetical protein